MRAVAKFIAPARNATSRPGPRFSSGCGATRRCAADQMIATAATRISAPSTPLAKYSALSWPKWCLSSAGRCAKRDRAQRDQSGGEVDQRLERVRPQAHRPGEVPGAELERDACAIDVAIDSKAIRRTALIGVRRCGDGVHGGPAATRGPGPAALTAHLRAGAPGGLCARSTCPCLGGQRLLDHPDQRLRLLRARTTATRRRR